MFPLISKVSPTLMALFWDGLQQYPIFHLWGQGYSCDRIHQRVLLHIAFYIFS